jgi:hypothetical protein
MRFARVRISMGQLMVLIAAFAFGLAISPRRAPYLALLPPVALGLAWLRPWPVAVPIITTLAICAVYELLLEIPIPGWIYAPIAILISGPLWPKGPDCRRSRRWIGLIAVNALILALFLIPWTPRKKFLRVFSSIKPGMTSSEVGRIMSPYGQHYEQVRTASGEHCILFTAHAPHWLIHKDWAMVKIRDGKVVEVGFWPSPY